MPYWPAPTWLRRRGCVGWCCLRERSANGDGSVSRFNCVLVDLSLGACNLRRPKLNMPCSNRLPMMYLPACVDIPRRVCAPDKKSSQSPNARGCTIARWEFFKSIGVVTKAISSDCSVHKARSEEDACIIWLRSCVTSLKRCWPLGNHRSMQNAKLGPIVERVHGVFVANSPCQWISFGSSSEWRIGEDFQQVNPEYSLNVHAHTIELPIFCKYERRST